MLSLCDQVAPWFSDVRLLCQHHFVTTRADAKLLSTAKTQPHAGARWWSLDIHSHSPASFDYGGIEGKASEIAKPSFKAWIKAYIDAGMDGIVITDHNSHDGITAARDALAELRLADPDLPEFVVFPGVELTVTGGVHVLGVFDPACEAEVVNRVLTLCEFTGERGRSDETANKTVMDAAKVIVAQHGICIPAHVDQKAGVFAMDSRDQEALSSSGLITAVEVVDDSETGKAERLGWVPVLGSDAHHMTIESCPDGIDAKAPGTHFTLVKAEKLDLEGLRLALTDPADSVRRYRRGYDDPNNVKHGHINWIAVTHDGATETYHLGPWMNCFIGGRGVGKSSLVEFVRLALGRSDELNGPVAEDLKRFHPSTDLSERWWNKDTQIVVEYTKDDRPLRITWSGSKPGRSAIEALEGSAWETQSGRVVDRAPVRIFSQKQIYQLATSPQSFLTILDDMPSIRKSEWKDEFEHLELALRGERDKLRQSLADAEKADRIRGQLEEVRGRLRHLAEVKATREYQELVATETRIKDAAEAERTAESMEDDLGSRAITLRGLVTDTLGGSDYADRAASFAAAAEFLEQAAAALQTARERWETGVVDEIWRERVDELTRWLARQGNPSSSVSAEQTQEHRLREIELQDALRVVESSEKRSQQQQAEINRLTKDIASKRKDLYARRRAYTQDLNKLSSLTRVDVHHQADTTSLGDQLRGLLNCPDSFESAFAEDGIAATLLEKEPKAPGFPEEIEKFKKSLVELVEKGAISEIGRSFKVDARFYGRLAAADKFELTTNILLWAPDDVVSVLHRPQKGMNLRPVDQGSPGQKTAAFLTVILQMGDEPLLLDQPEDDLENKLIRRLAVETLKQIKTRRQLIVSTHNANIVVTSSAENILVLQHGERLPETATEGTLQTKSVKNNVCEILEGGEDAIKTRYSRLIGPV